MIKVPRAPEADQVQGAEAEVPDTTRGQDLDQGIDIDVIEKDLILEDVILDQDLLPVKARDIKEKGNDLVQPRDLVEKGLTATCPKV